MIKSLQRGRYRPGNQSGAILVNVMVVLFFTGSLGYAAAAMIKQSNQTNTSNLRYLQAQWAANYAINKAVDDIITAGECDADIGPVNLANNEASYRYTAELSDNELYCFVRAEGLLSRGASDPAASVVKTVTLPLISDPATGGSALTTNGINAGFADSINSSHTLIESGCAGLTYDNCEDDWCKDPENVDYQKAMQVISGEPKLRESEFTLSSMFEDPDAPDSELEPGDIMEEMKNNVLSKAAELDSSCKFVSSEPATASCTTSGSGPNRRIVCTGSNLSNVFETKIINPFSCPEIALHTGSLNIDAGLKLGTDLDGNSTPMLFAHAVNSVDIEKSVNGIFSSEGNLDINLNGNQELDGLFIGTRTDALNISGTDIIRGLFSILSESDLEFQLNGGGNQPAVIEGAIFTNANMGINRNGHARISYNPDNINKWREYMPFLKEAGCGARSMLSASAVSDMEYKLF